MSKCECQWVACGLVFLYNRGMEQVKENLSSHSPIRWQYILLLMAQQSLDGMVYPIAKYGLSFIPPFTFAFFRFLIATAVLLTIVKLSNRNLPKVEKKDLRTIFAAGLLTIVFSQAAFLFGQKLTTVSHGSIIFATAPIWFFLGGIFFLKEKFILRRAIGVVFGLIGVSIILISGAIEMGTRYLLGDLVVLEAVLAWIYYLVICKPLIEKYGPLRVTAYTMTCGTLVYFPFGLYNALKTDFSNVPIGAWASIFYVALGLSVGYYLITNYLVKRIDLSRIAVYLNFQPVIASAIAVIFLGETIGFTFIAGWVIVITGVIITEV